MPKTLNYNAGSIIYCKGEEAQKVYILKSGDVSLVYDDIETGADTRDKVQPGEFFGIKSALGRYPQEENAIALTDTVAAAFTIPEFELYVMSNTKLIYKMFTVFSNRMRFIHNLVSEKESIRPDDGLFRIGEKYMKNKMYSRAKYVFSRYLTHYPDGREIVRVKNNLQFIETGFVRNVRFGSEFPGKPSPPMLNPMRKTFITAV